MIARSGAALLVAFGGPAAAQYRPAPGFESVDYTSDLVSGHSMQRFTLFLPELPAPPAGHPVIITISNPGFADTDTCYDANITGSVLYQFLDAGFAVVRGAVTFTDIGKHPSPCHATQTVLGNGLFHPPGITLSGLGMPPYQDHTRPFAEKDVVMLIQHVRHNAASMGLDGSRVSFFGRSGGATIGMWATFGPERGPGLFPSGGSGQDLASSRLDAAVLMTGAIYQPALAGNTLGKHFPAVDSGPLWEDFAPTLSQASSEFKLQASALVYQDHALNAGQRFFMTYGAEPESVDFWPATPGGTDYVAGVLQNMHASWNGYVWKQLHPHTYLVLTKSAALAAGAAYDLLQEDMGMLSLDMIDYLQQELALFNPVTPVGPGTPATSPLGDKNSPVFTGQGAFDGVTGGRASISNAAANAPLVLIYGNALLHLPLFGGTLGPLPELVFSGLFTDSNGSFELPLPANFALPGTTRYLQAWIVDPSGPQGLTASNTIAVSGT